MLKFLEIRQKLSDGIYIGIVHGGSHHDHEVTKMIWQGNGISHELLTCKSCNKKLHIEYEPARNRLTEKGDSALSSMPIIWSIQP